MLEIFAECLNWNVRIIHRYQEREALLCSFLSLDLFCSWLVWQTERGILESNKKSVQSGVLERQMFKGAKIGSVVILRAPALEEKFPAEGSRLIGSWAGFRTQGHHKDIPGTKHMVTASLWPASAPKAHVLCGGRERNEAVALVPPPPVRVHVTFSQRYRCTERSGQEDGDD